MIHSELHSISQFGKAVTSHRMCEEKRFRVNQQWQCTDQPILNALYSIKTKCRNFYTTSSNRKNEFWASVPAPAMGTLFCSACFLHSMCTVAVSKAHSYILAIVYKTQLDIRILSRFWETRGKARFGLRLMSRVLCLYKSESKWHWKAISECPNKHLGTIPHDWVLQDEALVHDTLSTGSNGLLSHVIYCKEDSV